MCNLLADEVAKNGAPRPDVTQAWITSAMKLLVDDDVAIEQIRDVIPWAQRHEWWRGRTARPSLLRKHWTTLWLQAKDEIALDEPMDDWAIRMNAKQRRIQEQSEVA